MVVGRHVGVEQFDPHAVIVAGVRFFREAAQIAGHALVRIETEHPVEREMFARRLQQQSAMATLGNPACLDIGFPRPVCHDQRDFRVVAQNFQRAIRTGVIIGDDRIDLIADVVQRVADNEGFVANAGDPDQELTTTQQAGIAGNDPVRRRGAANYPCPAW